MGELRIYNAGGHVDYGHEEMATMQAGEVLLPAGIVVNEEEPLQSRAELERDVAETGVLMPTSFWDRAYADDAEADANILLPPNVER